MILGLKRGVVELYDHDPEWEIVAAQTITQLKSIFGKIAVDIQHVGSTAIRSIKAKPIIDIAVGVRNFEWVDEITPALEKSGFFKRKWERDEQLLYACGDYTKPDGIVTHFIHVVLHNSSTWKHYIRFRDYCNTYTTAAQTYEEVKCRLAKENPIDPGRDKYIAGKLQTIQKILRKAQVWALLGRTVTVTVDRPAGTYHPRTKDIFYSINYGYLEDEIAPDGDGLDVYILGVAEPLKTFTGRVIGIIHREDDVEDKLVAAPDGMVFTQNEIGEAVHFVEQFYKTTVVTIYHKCAGMIVYRQVSGEPEYLVLFQHRSRTWSFPKGHMNAFETEEQTARREVQEEIGIDLAPLPNFRAEITYSTYKITKTVTFFLTELKGEPNLDNHEIKEYRWVSKDEAVRLIGNRDYIAILERAEGMI